MGLAVLILNLIYSKKGDENTLIFAKKLRIVDNDITFLFFCYIRVGKCAMKTAEMGNVYDLSKKKSQHYLYDFLGSIK